MKLEDESWETTQKIQVCHIETINLTCHFLEIIYFFACSLLYDFLFLLMLKKSEKVRDEAIS